jgi:AraC-like DNA-binding protein
MMDLLVEWRRSSESGERVADGPVAEACRLLAQGLGAREDLQDLVASIPLSYSRLRARFRAEMGMSMGDYRIQRRIEEACTHLSLPGANPQRIAMELGYSDYPAFSNQFRRRMGLSPRQYLVRLGVGG